MGHIYQWRCHNSEVRVGLFLLDFNLCCVLGVMSDKDGSSEGKSVRVILTDLDLETITVTELATRWRLQEGYLSTLEQRLQQQEGRYTIHSAWSYFKQRSATI